MKPNKFMLYGVIVGLACMTMAARLDDISRLALLGMLLVMIAAIEKLW